MRPPVGGFASLEAVLALVVLSLGGLALLQAGLGATRAVRDGRRWTDASLLGASVLGDIERQYRLAAPACVAPAGGVRAGRGVSVAWRVVAAAATVDVELARQASTRPGSVDTVWVRIACR